MTRATSHKPLITKLLAFPFLFLISLYKWCVSPFLPAGCRYHPTCSQYAKEAIGTHGVIKGGWMATKRICSCHPWGRHGYDPVPDED